MLEEINKKKFIEQIKKKLEEEIQTVNKKNIKN